MATNEDSEFSTTNVYKCSKCSYTVDNVEEMKTHIENCNNIEVRGENEDAICSIAEDNTMASVSLDALNEGEDESGSYPQWSHQATVNLLQFLKEELKSVKVLRSGPIFKSISKRLKAKGYNFNHSQCNSKWRNMKTYIRLKASTKKRGFHNISSWRYYDAMVELMKLWDEKKGPETVRLEQSSSEANSESDDVETDYERPVAKKMKISRHAPKWFREFRKDCERRHQERQAIATRLANTLDKFVERVNLEVDEESAMFDTNGDNAIARISFDAYNETQDSSGSFFQWSHEATVLLLQYLKQELKSPAKVLKTAPTFNAISKKLMMKGYNFTQSQCDVKWRNMKKNYVKVKIKCEARGYHNKSWRYFDAMEELVKLWDQKKGTKTGRVRLEQSSSDANSEIDTETDSNEQPEMKKMKLSRHQPKWFREFRKDCERRHQERQAIATRLANTLDKFVDRVNCKCYKKWK